MKNKADFIKGLSDYVANIYEGTKKTLKPNIHRGHLRSISTDIEDGIALFISNFLPEGFNVYLDPSIYFDGKTYRPDLIVADSHGNACAMIEIKANMGWCRDAKPVVDELLKKSLLFRKERKIRCKLSNENELVATVNYENEAPLFILSFTDGNCGKEEHKKNKDYANQNGVKLLFLFSGWYNSLENKDVIDFADELEAMVKSSK